MNVLMMIVQASVREELETFLTREGVRGYSEIPEVHGVGRSGRRMGSAAYPATNSVIFAIVEDALLARITGRLQEYCQQCHEQIHMLHWPANVMS